MNDDIDDIPASTRKLVVSKEEEEDEDEKQIIEHFTSHTKDSNVKTKATRNHTDKKAELAEKDEKVEKVEKSGKKGKTAKSAPEPEEPANGDAAEDDEYG